jgi:hypothetical protein
MRRLTYIESLAIANPPKLGRPRKPLRQRPAGRAHNYPKVGRLAKLADNFRPKERVRV